MDENQSQLEKRLREKNRGQFLAHNLHCVIACHCLNRLTYEKNSEALIILDGVALSIKLHSYGTTK